MLELGLARAFAATDQGGTTQGHHPMPRKQPQGTTLEASVGFSSRLLQVDEGVLAERASEEEVLLGLVHTSQSPWYLLQKAVSSRRSLDFDASVLRQ